MTGLLRHKGGSFLALATLLVGSCTWGLGSGGEDTPAMHRDLSKTVDIQTAVIQGDLDRAREAAAWLAAQHPATPAPSGPEVYLSDLGKAAGLIAQAEDLSTAASNTGQIGATCGGCHVATGGGPRFSLQAGPPPGDSQGATMVRHLWSVDRLWEGLVGPSDYAWLAGAKALEASLALPAGTLRGPDALLRQVGNMAVEAQEIEGQTARAEVFGRIIATCSQCHGSG
jgi:mono/diheme cytochrome c family protein